MRPLVLAMIAASLVLPSASARAERAARPSASEVRTLAGMARIPAGSYRPLYGASGTTRAAVGAFLIDRAPVTRGDFERFVATHPAWQRGVLRAVFAGRGYLAEWPSATRGGDTSALRGPVTSVSWFAARAYCAALGKRLPTVDEWEYVAAADETRRDASADPAFRRRVLAMNAVRASVQPATGRSAPNVYGVRDLHGVVWEWTEDFNSVVVADDSRAAGSAGDARDHHLYCASAAIGASDPTNYPAFMRSAVRAGLTARSSVRSVGFRCAADLPG